MPKVFNVKYATTKGILEVEVREPKPSDGDYRWTEERYPLMLTKRDWAATREEAVKMADALRKRRIASLQKSIAKLEKMTFA